MQAGWFELQNTRDWYRQACGPAGMKRSHVLRFIEVCPLTQNSEYLRMSMPRTVMPMRQWP